jgi:hypothetical protein
MAFLITGLAGFRLGHPVAHALPQTPRKQTFWSADELELIEDGGKTPPEEGERKSMDLGQGADFQAALAASFGRLLTDPVWYFYQFWFAKYLSTGPRDSTNPTLTITWIVYAAAGVGSLAGGWLSKPTSSSSAVAGRHLRRHRRRPRRHLRRARPGPTGPRRQCLQRSAVVGARRDLAPWATTTAGRARAASSTRSWRKTSIATARATR